jgi:hypothetical protein
MITVDLGCNRSMKRKEWNCLWRHMRIMQREMRKAATDCVIFGSGFIETGEHIPDGIRAVPANEVHL